MRKLQLVAVALVALSFIVAFIAQPMLPDRVATHWNIKGEADGFSDNGVGAFLMPIISLVLLGMFYVLPIIDPKRQNYKLFQNEYDGMVVALVGFFFYLYLLTLAINMGYALNMMQYLAPAFGALFYYLGVVISKAKQNWFVGIRTPWTLSSEKVWDKTHALGGKLFKAAGVVAILGAVMPDFFIASIAVMLAAAVATLAYSYVEFDKERKKK